MKTRKGFTLIELVVVIAIIAVLSMVLVPSFMAIFENAKRSNAMQAFQNAYFSIYSDANANPTDGVMIYFEKIEDAEESEIFSGVVYCAEIKNGVLKTGEKGIVMSKIESYTDLSAILIGKVLKAGLQSSVSNPLETDLDSLHISYYA